MKTKKHSTTLVETNLTSTTLVLGGGGKTGRRIVQRLQNKGMTVRIGSRSTTPSFDWNDPATWDATLEGVESIYIAYHPDLAAPGASDHIRALVKKAREKRVRRLVLLSGRGEEEAQLCERIVMNSGIPATVVRCSWFNQNFSESFFRDMVMSGTIALPVGNIREPFVDVEDIADVAVAALTERGHTGEIYEVTGPRLISFTEVAREISQASDRPIQHVQIPHEQFIEGLHQAGLPHEMVTLINYLFTEVLDGRNESLGDGVQKALGRVPRDFSDFAKRAAAEGSWR